VQLPDDPTQDLAVLPPRLAAPAIQRQQRLHAGEGFVGELEHRTCSWIVVSSNATLSSSTTTSTQVRLQY
jgi:hypothetical protein